jgi:hypothetical protein
MEMETHLGLVILALLNGVSVNAGQDFQVILQTVYCARVVPQTLFLG